MIFGQFLHTASIGASYLFGCGSQGQCVVADPFGDIAPYEQISRETGMPMVHVIDTHVHADHRCGGRAFADAQQLVLGNTTRVFHTPGHTPEQACLLVTDHKRETEPWFVVTGHTLMVGDMGRTELATNAETGNQHGGGPS